MRWNSKANNSVKTKTAEGTAVLRGDDGRDNAFTMPIIPRLRDRVNFFFRGDMEKLKNKNTPFEAALTYASHGWHVLPIKPKDKVPLTAHGKDDATIDDTKIKAWSKKYPSANVGIATGKVSRIVVLDVDAGKGGMETLARLESERGRLPKTLSAITGGGGRHFFFAHPGRKVGNRVNIAPGLDVRGDGGYIVAPPSIHKSGTRYEWVDPDEPIAVLPEWLLTLMVGETRTTSNSKAIPSGLRYGPYIDAAIRDELDELARAVEGSRNDQLFQSSSSLGQFIGAGAVDRSDIEQRLAVVARSIGLAEQETVRTIRSGIEAGMREPRDVPHNGNGNNQGAILAITDGNRKRRGSLAHYDWLPTEMVLDASYRGETGDAEIFEQLFTNRIVFTHSENAWYFYQGHFWVPDRKEEVVRLVSSDVASQYLHAAAELERTDREHFEKTIKSLQQRANSLRYRAKIANVLSLAKSQNALALTGEEWDRDPMRLGVMNGVLDLRSGELCEGDPQDYVRKVSPTEWWGLNTPAPRWEQFLDEIFEANAVLIAFIHRLLGYAITGLSTEHRLPVFGGEGRNGKDTLLETLAHVLGELATPVSADVLIQTDRKSEAPTPHLCALQGRRLCWVNESNEGARLNEAQVKWLSGGGQIVARAMYAKNPVRFDPQYLLILVTNHKPHANADDYALWQRLLLIPFTQSFVENPMAANEHKRDTNLRDTLKVEAPGILAWLVRGTLEYLRTGLNPPKEVIGATEDYRADEDSIAQFIAERCALDDNAQVKASALYAQYRNWSESNGLSPMTGTAFGRRMGKRLTKETGAFVIYKGIKIRI